MNHPRMHTHTASSHHIKYLISHYPRLLILCKVMDSFANSGKSMHVAGRSWLFLFFDNKIFWKADSIGYFIYRVYACRAIGFGGGVEKGSTEESTHRVAQEFLRGGGSVRSEMFEMMRRMSYSDSDKLKMIRSRDPALRTQTHLVTWLSSSL